MQTRSAREVLAATREDHNWKPDPIDLTSTGGIQRAITAQWHAIEALADYIDGKVTDPETGYVYNKDGQRIDAQGKVIDSEDRTASFESRPVVARDPAGSELVA